jgi:hypothetical protein
VELMVVNLIAVKSSLDAYKFPVPWLTISISLFATILSGFLISNSDEQFSNNNNKSVKENADIEKNVY